MTRIHYGQLPTEQSNPSSLNLEAMTIGQMVRLMCREDRKVPPSVYRQRHQIESAVSLIVRSLKAGGRIFFTGAGTSGRLGVLESAELPPTFNTRPFQFQAIMAGGREAVFRSQEGAEDDTSSAKKQILKSVRRGDVVIGIAASGVTPFVRSALETAGKLKASRILVTCNPKLRFSSSADVTIAPKIGPEILAGSTRLKSATATKMILNMLTTISMVRLGKVYGNRMVDLQAKSKKLRERAIGIVQELAGLSRVRAETILKKNLWNVKASLKSSL